MSLEALKLDFIQRVLCIEDEVLIRKLDAMLVQMEAHEPQPMTLAELEKRIAQAKEDAEAGRYTTSEELKEKIKRW